MKKYFLILGLLLVIYSCRKTDAPVEEEFNLLFENPQPINDSELSKIPNKFLGLFMDSDSGYLNIKENIILREYFYKFKVHKNILDSIKDGFDLVGNRYISKDNKDVYDYRSLGDSIEFSNKGIDTVFIFSNEQKAKRIDGQLILNYKDSIYWDIRSIRVEKDILKITYSYFEKDLKRIDSLTKIKYKMIDSTSYIIKPSRKEFKRILNLKNIGYKKDYKRVTK